MIHSFKGNYLCRAHCILYSICSTEKSHCGVILYLMQVFKRKYFGDYTMTAFSLTCVKMKEFCVHDRSPQLMLAVSI